MKRTERPFLFSKDKSKAHKQRLEAIARLKVMEGMTEQEARAYLRAQNHFKLRMPSLGELCLAKTRRGTPCQARALPSGRCRFHGGLSTGPKTPAGKARALSRLKQFRTRAG